MLETSCLTPSATRPRAVGTPTEFVRIGSLVVVETGTGTLPSYAQTLPRIPESVCKARHLVCLALAAWGLDGLRDAVEVVVSELMTNAVLHARRDAVRVTVTRLGSERVHIAVVDLARKGPQTRPAGADEESGRGLEIVEKLSGGNWGVDPLPWGKRVWAECALKDVLDE
ncbi:ATP-binding protein [Streptomyces acidiscabies]|uniref:ATP-binding protein n=1 Tax=Streptomyces acidiscabies TaxID=42234 RepID=UPI000A69A422|nr:ATP-binding protein [Streptomyces acidiscabies]